MRELIEHHDGHGLNDLITITCDDKDPGAGNASHHYKYTMPSEHPDDVSGEVEVGHVQFQHGARNVEGSKSGVTEAAVLVMLIDRIESFQVGPYPCEENDRMLAHLKGALQATQDRVENRASRGVLGTNAT